MKMISSMRLLQTIRSQVRFSNKLSLKYEYTSVASVWATASKYNYSRIRQMYSLSDQLFYSASITPDITASANVASISDLQTKVDKAEGEIENVNDEIEKVSRQIESVELSVRKVEDEILSTADLIKRSNDANEMAYLRKKEEQLRDEKKQLGDEKKQLRDEKKVLEEKKSRIEKLRDEEKSRFDELMLNYGTVETIKYMLEKHSMIPSKIGPAKELIDLGDIPREHCSLLNRQAALDEFQLITADRLKKKKMADKESHPYVICMSGPGTGKSRLADYGLEALKKCDSKKYPALHALANDNAVAVHVSFNSHTHFDRTDQMIGNSAALGCRLLSSYFGIDTKVMFNKLRSLATIHTLNAGKCIELIFEDHRQRNNLDSGRDVLLYVAIDDVTSICNHLEQNKMSGDKSWTFENGKEYLKNMLIELSSHLTTEREGANFFAMMITGTIYGPVSEIIKYTFRRYINLRVPLLSLEQSKVLAKGAFKDAGLGAFDTSGDFECIMSDFGGIPRFVWEFINETIKLLKGGVKPNSLSPESMKIHLEYIRATVKTSIHKRYSLNDFSGDKAKQMAWEVLYVAITRKCVNPNHFVGNNATYLWADLENQGKVFFHYHNAEAVEIVLPIVHMEFLAEILKFHRLTEAISFVRDATWFKWEFFTLTYEAVLLELYSRMGHMSIPVTEYYRGARIGNNLKKLMLSIPQYSGIGASNIVTVKEFKRRFPDTKEGECEEIVTDGSVIYINVRGASADGLYWHIPTQGKKGLVVCKIFHMKYTSPRGKSKFNIHEARSKAAADIEPMRKDFGDLTKTKLLHVHITNRKLSGDFNDMSSDDIVICRDNVVGYFGLGFADRILIAARDLENFDARNSITKK